VNQQRLSAPGGRPDPYDAVDIASYQDLLRRRRGWSGNPSLDLLARRTSIPRSTLHDALRAGKRSLPSLDLVTRLMSALGADRAEVARWVAAWRAVQRAYAAGPTPPRQLPAEPAGFVGRRAELKELEQVQRAGVLVLTGPAGVGKTALALHWAHQIAASFPDGQLYVDLRGSAPTPVSADRALAALLGGLGETGRLPEDPEDLAGMFRTRVAQRRVLVLLDNAADAAQVRPLLPAGRSLILITGRRPLTGLVTREGARHVELPPLTMADSSDLLAAVLGVERIGREEAAAAEVARLCGRMPLRLRIAAAELADNPEWTISEYVSRLREAGGGSSAAAAAVPFQLPPPPPMMVGRSAEASRLIAAAARDGAVCAIEGVGGVGKSALALHVAHQLASRQRGGCLYADLRGGEAGLVLAQPADVLAQFLRALGVPTVPASLTEASALYRTLTAERGVLVLLDNAAAAAQVRPLLPGGRGCATVVTSRWSLADLDASVRVHLDPLPDDAALGLLVRLSGADRIAAEPDAAALVVRRCGGLPLALRIAGARAAARGEASLSWLAERIDDEDRRLDVLEVGDLSVRASLRLGYQAFSDAEQDERRRAAGLFRLAALPDWADTTPRACAALAGWRVAATERAVDLLVDAHLLESSGPGRYRYHDIVRLFAREQALAAEPEAARAAASSRLLHWLLGSTAAAARLLYPHDPLPPVASSRAASSHHPTAAHLAGTGDAWNWFDSEHTNLLMVARQQLTAGRALAEVRDLALVVAKFLDYAGYVAEEQQFGQLAVEAAQRLDDRSGTALALNIVAVTMLRQGRLDEGIRLLERNLAEQRALGDRAREAACLNNLGNALRDKGDLDGAVRYLQAALAIRRELGDRHKEGSVLDNLALVFQRRGEYAQAIDHHRAGLDITRAGTDLLLQAQALVNFAETLLASGDHAAAAFRARESLAICRRYEHRRGIGLALRVLGDAAARQGHMPDAHRHWREALDTLDGLDPGTSARLRAALGVPNPT
jgi:tetratricopeptide (TPR) repeat protein/Mrp family chromosome partitioning ATPase